MNRELFAKYQFNAKCTTNTLGHDINPWKAIITAPVGLHVKLNTMEGSAMRRCLSRFQNLILISGLFILIGTGTRNATFH